MGIASGLIGGAIAVALGTLAIRSQRGPSVDAYGWKLMRPGWYLHLALIGCIAFVLVIGWFFLQGGSSRADAVEQNQWALLLMLAFGAGGLWVLWAGYLRRIMWKGAEIRVIAPFGTERRYCFSEIVDMTEGVDGSEIKLHMDDGSVMRVSVYFHGFQNFMNDIEAYFSTLDRAD